MRFPNVSGSNLEGRQFKLPADFEGELNLVLIAFEQWQQALVNTWMPFANQLMRTFPALKTYELPTIQNMGWFNEKRLDLFMRLGIPDKAVREATITLYLDQRDFMRALDLPTLNTIYVLLVDNHGNVVWRTNGAFDPSIATPLQETITATLKSASQFI